MGVLTAASRETASSPIGAPTTPQRCALYLRSMRCTAGRGAAKRSPAGMPWRFRRCCSEMLCIDKETGTEELRRSDDADCLAPAQNGKSTLDCIVTARSPAVLSLLQLVPQSSPSASAAHCRQSAVTWKKKASKRGTRQSPQHLALPSSNAVSHVFHQ